jgi:hypothetical protein
VTPQDEALKIFEEVVRQITSGTYALKSVLLRCYHASQLIGLSQSRDWFYREAYGYPPDADLPWYRQIKGQFEWWPRGMDNQVETAMMAVNYGDRDGGDIAELEARGPADSLFAANQRVYRLPTGETRDGRSAVNKRSQVEDRVKRFEPGAFATAIQQIEQLTLAFASHHYTVLRYGNVITDIWLDRRARVDAALAALGLGQHLDTIQADVRSSNPESWRAAVLACRNLLTDIANHLWQDPRKTYPPLKGQDGQPMAVTKDKYTNQLRAYLHQKRTQLDEKAHDYLKNELERLADSLRLLISYQSTGHGPITQEDARSVAISTYFLTGELVVKTDMAPVTTYA